MATLREEPLSSELIQYGEFLLEGANKLLEMQKLIDGSVQCIGSTSSFICHRVLLATSSPKLFDVLLKQNASKMYTLDTKSDYILNVLKSYLYTGIITLHHSSVSSCRTAINDNFLFPEIKQAFDVFMTIAAKNLNKQKFLVKGNGTLDLTAVIEVISRDPLICKFDIRKMRIKVMLELLEKLHLRSHSQRYKEQFDIFVGSSGTHSNESKMFGAHKLLLAIACQKIRPLLLQNPKIPAVKFGGVVTDRAIASTLKYLYTGRTDLGEMHDGGQVIEKRFCWEVMKTAQTFGIPGLENIANALIHGGMRL